MGKKKINKKMMKKYLIFTFAAVGVLFIGLSWYFMSDVDSEGDDEDFVPDEGLVVEDDRDKLIRERELDEVVEVEEEPEPVDVDEASRERAKSNLENVDEPVEEDERISEEDLEQMNVDLVDVFNFYAEDKDWEGNYYASREFSNSIAGQTSVDMSQQVDTAVNVIGYEMDPSTAEWYKSETEGVYQFLVSLKAEGYDDLVFSGNYNKESQVFNIFKMHGILDLDNFAS